MDSKSDDLPLRNLTLAKDYVEKLRSSHPDVKQHSERVARLCERLASHMNLSSDEVKAAEMAGALHDIGKVHVPRRVLEKPAALSDDELLLIQEVPAYSAAIAYLLGLAQPIQRAISQRHERPDGKGYPCGLRGQKISVIAKIVAVADTYDSLTHDQPYRKAIAMRDAIGIIRSKTHFQFDADVVDCLTRLLLPPH